MEEGNAEAAAEIDKALRSFVCYLYVGKSHPLYKARPWNDDDHYSQGQRIRNLETLAAYKKTELVPIDKIKLAMDSKLIRRPETLMFALAMCARQRKSEKLRAAAYYFLAEHCKEWKYFILFIKYASYLCKLQGSKNKDEDKKPIGWGHGWKNAVNKWYLTKDVADLVYLVTRHKGNHGWTHKDIFKLSHPENGALEVEKQAILRYVMNGLEAAQQKYDDDPEAKKILLYISCVEFFKKCRYKDQVVKMIASHKFTIDYVHPTALKHKEVWLALLKEMDVRTILNNLPKLNQWGLLTKVGPATPIIVRSLTDRENLKWNTILPAEILTVLNRYESSPTVNFPYRFTKNLEVKSEESEATPKSQSSRKGKRVTVVNSQRNDKSKSVRPSKRFIETKEPDMRIRDALRTALTIAQTVDITRSSKKKYLVAVRLPGRRRSSHCSDAGLALALPLLHRDGVPDDAVTIIGYEPKIGNIGGGLTVPITKDMNFDDALVLLHELKSYNKTVLSMPLGPLGWAYKEKKAYDVFINVTNEPPSEDLAWMMGRYKQDIKPDIRFINVIIHRVPFELKKEVWTDSLIINGFDPHVPWIIEAYVRGLF